jgi:two-component system sensor histidine kinase PhoQ
LLLAASVALLAFLGLAGFALDKAFQNRTEVAVEDRLRGQVFSLLVAADLDREGQLRMTEESPEPRLQRIGSGLYATIVDAGRQRVWRSRRVKKLPCHRVLIRIDYPT